MASCRCNFLNPLLIRAPSKALFLPLMSQTAFLAPISWPIWMRRGNDSRNDDNTIRLRTRLPFILFLIGFCRFQSRFYVVPRKLTPSYPAMHMSICTKTVHKSCVHEFLAFRSSLYLLCQQHCIWHHRIRANSGQVHVYSPTFLTEFVHTFYIFRSVLRGVS